MTASPPVKTILILAANPKGTTPLRLDEEVREIEAGLRRARQRDRFVLKQRWATRSLDIQRAILDENPQIVHFCGIEKAHQLAQQQERPQLLPVRLAYRQPFQYPLSEYLNRLNWAFWQAEGDTPGLIDQLQQAIAGAPLPIDTQADKAQLIQPTTDASPPKPAPMAQPPGKQTLSSLRLELPEGTMTVESKFYMERPEDCIALETIGEAGVTLTIKGARQMGKSSPLIRVMDWAVQVGKQVAFLDFQMFDKATLGQADQFFSQFCLWLTDTLDLEDRVDQYWRRSEGNRQRCSRYVRRHILPSLEQPLVLAMDEIDDLNQSPFNVGEVLELRDFSLDQLQDLNQRHGAPLTQPQAQQLMRLGQALLQVVQNQTCQDERLFFRLRGAGLVRRAGAAVAPRCQLYASYFQAHLR